MKSFVIFAKSGDALLEIEVTGLPGPRPSLPVKETASIGFELLDPGEDEYEIAIGDRLLVDIHQELGSARRGRRNVDWAVYPWLDGARGVTPITLRAIGGAEPLLQVNALVEPSKLTLAAYDQMFQDISRVSIDLLLDLIAKSRLKLVGRASGTARPRVISARVELSRIKRFWRGFAPLLAVAMASPVLQGRREIQVQPLTRAVRVDGRLLQRLSAAGLRPEAAARSGHPFPLSVVVPTIDTPEHRAIRGFLTMLRDRVLRGHRLAVTELAQLHETLRPQAEGDAALRDFLRDREAPRLARLKAAKAEAESLLADIAAQAAEFGAVPVDRFQARSLRQALDTPVFRSEPNYGRLAAAMRAFVEQSALVVEEGSDERAKPIETVFEQWTFFQVVAGLRAAGLDCVSHRALFEPLTRNRFSIDLDRNAAVIFQAPDGRRVSLRYEPTILPKAAAQGIDTLYRGNSTSRPYTPDIVLEVFAADQGSAEDRLVYAAVIDAKYTKPHNLDKKLEDIEKYVEIRSGQTHRQIVRQIWVAAPIEAGVEPRDTTILWSADGEVSAKPDDQIRGKLGLDPAHPAETLEAAKSLVLGILNHARAFAGT